MEKVSVDCASKRLGCGGQKSPRVFRSEMPLAEGVCSVLRWKRLEGVHVLMERSEGRAEDLGGP